ncbi:unnamed protein product [Calypogeia fissa]
MGQRASLLSCVSPACVTGGCDKVRIQKPCGEFEEVASPCVASKVMGKHPDYLVVHCSLAKCGAVDITVIAPNQDLLPGVPYMFYPKAESTIESSDSSQVVTNIPGAICMSMKDRQLTFRSSRSPNSWSRKSLSKNDGEKVPAV